MKTYFTSRFFASLVLLLLVCPILASNAAIFLSERSGNWEQGDRWNQGNAVPGADDAAWIVGGNAITVVDPQVCGQLRMIDGSVTISGSGELMVNELLDGLAGTSLNLNDGGLLNVAGGSLAALRLQGDTAINLISNQGMLSVAEVTTLFGATHLTKGGEGTLQMQLLAPTTQNNYTLTGGKLILQTIAGPMQTGRIDVTGDAALEVFSDGVGTITELRCQTPGELTFDVTNTDNRILSGAVVEKLTLNAEPESEYKLRTNTRVQFEDVNVVKEGPTKLIKLGIGEAFINTDNADLRTQLTLVTQEGRITTTSTSNEGNATVGKVLARGGTIGADTGKTLTILDELRIEEGATFSPGNGIVLGEATNAPSKQIALLDGENAVLDLTGQRGLKFYGTLGDGRGKIRYATNGLDANRLTGDLFVGDFSLVKGTLETGGYQVMATNSLALGDLNVKTGSTDAGPIGVESSDLGNEAVKKTISVRGGTVELETSPNFNSQCLAFAAEEGKTLVDVHTLSGITDGDPATPLELASLTTSKNAVLSFHDGVDLNVGEIKVRYLDGNGGELQLKGSSLIVGSGLDAAASHVFSGTITDDGLGTTFTKEGNGTQIFTGHQTYAGATVINAGVLQLGNGGTSGSIANDVFVAENGTLAVGRNDEYRLDSNIIGGNLTGSGTLAVNNAATGKLVLTSDPVLPKVEVNSGTLQLGDGATSFGTLTPQRYTFNAGSTLALDLPAAGLPEGTSFDLSGASLHLRGSYASYTDAMLRSVARDGKLAGLRVDLGTNLTVVLNPNSPQTAPITVADTGSISLNPANLIVDATHLALTSSEESYSILQAGSLIKADGKKWMPQDLASINTLAAYDKERYFWYYSVDGGELNGTLLEANLTNLSKTLTNGVALASVIQGGSTAGTATSQMRQQLLVLQHTGSSQQQLDAIMQQFTPSMAAATISQVTTAPREVMRQVETKMADTWNEEPQKQDEMRGQQGSYATANSLSAWNGTYHVDYRKNAWFQTFGYTGVQNAKAGFAGFDTQGWGFAAGYDRKFGRNLLVGTAYGYADNKIASQNWNTLLGATTNPSTSTTQTHTALIYSLLPLGDTFYLSAKMGGSWGMVDGERRPTVNTLNTYNTNTTTFLVQTNVGCSLVATPTFRLTPKLGVSYFDFKQEGYDEVTTTGLTSVGAFSDTYIEFDAMLESSLRISSNINACTTVGYRSVLGAEGSILNVQSDGLTYSVEGIEPATSVLVLDLGADILLTNQISFFAEYNFRYGDGGSYLHGGTGTVVMRF